MMCLVRGYMWDDLSYVMDYILSCQAATQAGELTWSASPARHQRQLPSGRACQLPVSGSYRHHCSRTISPVTFPLSHGCAGRQAGRLVGHAAE